MLRHLPYWPGDEVRLRAALLRGGEQHRRGPVLHRRRGPRPSLVSQGQGRPAIPGCTSSEEVDGVFEAELLHPAAKSNLRPKEAEHSFHPAAKSHLRPEGLIHTVSLINRLLFDNAVKI